ncbi:hypothetical protein GCM10025770_38010 [Viridibacterium curvum]|uniref:Uncharacterized protein n=1 Tax=Viridibacterium curvum TaxID=1101404 RepID=A0ABP9R770_9RHOO
MGTCNSTGAANAETEDAELDATELWLELLVLLALLELPEAAGDEEPPPPPPPPHPATSRASVNATIPALGASAYIDFQTCVCILISVS